MNRIEQLKKNYSRIFWIEAFFYINFVNMIAVLFYLHRGLTLKQILFLPIIYSITNLLFEIPSSYLADIWGRKKTIILSCIVLSSSYVLAIFSDGFLMFSFVVATYSLAIALLSGTSEALIYDTAIELKEKDQDLKKLSTLHSAKHIFKIVTPFLATIIVRDLSESQFVLIYFFNSLIAFVSFSLSLFLIEANHNLDIEKKQLGIFKDAIKSLKNNPNIVSVVMNRTLIFISSILVFLIFQKLFTDIGVSIITIGFVWSAVHTISYFIMKNFTKIFHNINFSVFINHLNIATTLMYLICFLSLEFFPYPHLVLILFSISTIFVIIRHPVFSQYFNNNSNSFNRATSLSLLNISKGVLDVPIMLLAAYTVSQNINYVFFIAFMLGLITITFFRIKKQVTIST